MTLRMLDSMSEQNALERKRLRMYAAQKRWRAAHPERARQVARENKARYRAENPREAREYQRTYQDANREALREQTLRRLAAVKSAVFDHYGHTCACCGSSEKLTIDHVGGGGQEHRKEIGGGGPVMYRWLVKNGFPDGYQTLCNPCNSSKAGGAACRRDHPECAP
jgi:hypothetical protein